MGYLNIETITPDHSLFPQKLLLARNSHFVTLYFLGRMAILQLPLTAIFCSRKCPGESILKAYDLAGELRDKETPVISGFHTPVEKDMLDILLKGKGPIVVCPARGLEGMRISNRYKQRIEQGTLLFISCFPLKEKRITQKNGSPAQPAGNQPGLSNPCHLCFARRRD